ncbi:MAG: secretin N-terminal domain-containing protein [Pirellulaceae bacterium]|nr:secretin N-terminal domain-containing protein [Pirellulaceae bacterium]
MTLAATAPAQQRTPAKQGGDAVKDREQDPKTELRVYAVKNAVASEVLLTLRTLMPDLNISAVVSSNSVIVEGDANELKHVDELLSVIDRVDERRQRVVRVFQLRRPTASDPVMSAIQWMQMHSPRQQLMAAFDDVAGRLIVSASSADEMAKIESLIEAVDVPVQAAAAAESLRIRFVWLAAGSEDGGPPPPKDMGEVVTELERIGIRDLRMRGQFLVNSNGTGSFTVNGSVTGDDKEQSQISISVNGQVEKTEHDRVTLGVTASLTQVGVRGQTSLADLETSISAKFGHFVVLGAAPSKKETSVFVLRVMPN